MSSKTVYIWLYSDFLDVSLNVTKETRGKFNIGKTIKERLSEVSTKEIFGHRGSIQLVSSRRETFVELKTRVYVGR
ncbi:hypothetical protein [Leptotrichia buccalis]|uniref:hypothetical protein n=1 Tax=Leptotrichia buccalis TaxID=40542 RepID=UPI00019EBD50|nr:hypothetical protein [Leptotrichia buccalis]